jgi:hypothetical protein
MKDYPSGVQRRYEEITFDTSHAASSTCSASLHLRLFISRDSTKTDGYIAYMPGPGIIYTRGLMNAPEPYLIALLRPP